MGKLGRQVAAFGIVGVATFLLDYSILMALTQLARVDATPAAAVAFTASVAANYLASTRFVFSRRKDCGRTTEATVFVLLSLIGLAANEAIMWLGTNVLGQGPLAVTLTKMAATGIVMCWNFWSRRKWLDEEGQRKRRDAHVRRTKVSEQDKRRTGRNEAHVREQPTGDASQTREEEGERTDQG